MPNVITIATIAHSELAKWNCPTAVGPKKRGKNNVSKSVSTQVINCDTSNNEAFLAMVLPVVFMVYS